MNPKPMVKYPIPDYRTLIVRGWRRKCPQCGRGPIYRRWLNFHERCPECGLVYLPNQGDLFGPLVFLDRALFLIPFIVLFYFRVWHPPLAVYLVCGGAMIFGLIYTLPHRNGVSLAFDYLMRRRGGDLMDPNEPDAK